MRRTKVQIPPSLLVTIELSKTFLLILCPSKNQIRSKLNVNTLMLIVLWYLNQIHWIYYCSALYLFIFLVIILAAKTNLVRGSCVG